MKTTFIYALCEPGTRTVRYIGKADKLKKRFQEHLRTSVKYRSHLGNWLRSLISRGEKPSLVSLREVPFTQWAIAEERYIRLARGCGMNLVNETDGGEGMSNPSPEVLEKLSAARQGEKNPMFGKKFTPEHCANISRGLLGKSPPPFTTEHCENIRKGLLGKEHTLERRARISVALKASWARRKGTNV